MTSMQILPSLANLIFLQGLLFLPLTGANEAGERLIFVSSTTDIYLSQGPVYEFEPMPLDVGRPEGIDYDDNINMLFWTDSEARAIKRVDLGSTEYEWMFVTSTSESPGEIAVDEKEHLIFWTRTRPQDGAITRVNYEGVDRRQIVGNGNTSSILSITLDKDSRTIYWTEGTKLRRSTYEGFHKETLYNSPSDEHNLRGVVLNDDASKVYWCRFYTLDVMDLTQTELRSIELGIVNACGGSAWFEGYIYWTDYSLVMVRDKIINWLRVIASFPDSVTTTDVCAGRIVVPGLDGGACDFERIGCHWKFRNSMSNNLTWTRSSAHLAKNSSIGPATDHTTQSQSGHYMILNPEPQFIAAGESTTFFSPQVNTSLTEPRCFRFWYYMHDVTNGSLTVLFEHEDQTGNRSSSDESSIDPGPIWSAYGSQPDEWVGAEVEIRASGVGRILLKAIVGNPRSNIIAIDDVGYGVCHQDSRLICEESSMTVYLDRARLGISSQDRVSFSNICWGVDFDADTVAITTPYNGCGTTVSESDSVILFSNQVNVDARSGIRNTNMTIRVNCSFSRAYHVGMTYLAHAWIKYISEDAYGNFSVGIRQYINAEFEEAFSSSMFPQQVDVDDSIFMATEMVTIADLVDTHHNQRCWATSSADPTDPVNCDIIMDGCPVGTSTKVYAPPRAELRPFSFKAFSFGQGVSLIYIHCNVIICHQSEESACSTDCSHSRSRESRGARDPGSGPYTVSQGPFIYKMNSREDGAPVNTFLLSALVCMTALLLTTVFVGIFIYMRTRTRTIPVI